MKATLVYPHQLYKKNPALKKNVQVYLIEEPLMMGEFPIHVQKMMFHRLSIQNYKKELEKKGYKVNLIKRDIVKKTEDVFLYLQKDKVTHLNLVDTTDFLLEKRINKAIKKYNWTSTHYDSPLFIFSKKESIYRYNKSKKHLYSFYKQARIDKNILISKGKPVGDKWSFDENNRKKIPKNHDLPSDIVYFENKEVKDVETWVKNLKNIKLYGEVKNWVPYTRLNAQKWFEEFLQNRFFLFGTYEDAMISNHTRLYHSVISPLLNCGLLSPDDVLNKAICFAKKENIPVNCIEGFVRQILGWREFIRASYEVDSVKMRTRNFFKHSNKLKKCWWEGKTNLKPLDNSIKRALKFGYNHHIERLMVIGNSMLLTQTDPDEVYKWFMSMYIDAYDWVMIPNIYGMSQFSDGGIFATKPYISGANYIKKMSNYSKDIWEDYLTGLYWNFIKIHKNIFLKNHRMSMMPRLLDKMDSDKKAFYFKKAKEFIELIKK